MAFTVFYDSCTLYPNTLRDLLVRLELPGIIQAKWTEQILDEVDRALIERGISPEKNAERRRRMNNAARDCLVTNY